MMAMVTHEHYPLPDIDRAAQRLTLTVAQALHNADPVDLLSSLLIYPSLWDKAAALLHSIVLGHPLVDGNKRLGWLAATTFLSVNGHPVDKISADAALHLVESIAIHHLEVEDISSALQELARG
ncbi:type II toxin-antitoxin system death-on-curing family toxin [Candidatus Poriferisocius sp.]|uniref:type II toxin-antitoxin system death-on-curing family toxin n=1 Tax=Candidatus Poriferisocius sp. TaxID=3101276 RepID=UPI003B02EB5D